MRTIILGATKGMGRELARLMARRGDRLYLLGRAEEELKRSAQDLEAQGASGSVGYCHCDLAKRETLHPALRAATEEMGGFDCLVITAAQFGPQEELAEDPERTAALLDANFANTVLLCEDARRTLLEQGGGTLCVFSSVAGDRGRKPVILYGASKAGLSHYLEGLDHRHRAEGLVTICVKPGFVKTGMTAGLKPPPFAGEPEQVARDVLKAIDRGKPMIYTPWPWRWVMLIIRNLPRFVMRRIGF